MTNWFKYIFFLLIGWALPLTAQTQLDSLVSVKFPCNPEMKIEKENSFKIIKCNSSKGEYKVIIADRIADTIPEGGVYSNDVMQKNFEFYYNVFKKNSGYEITPLQTELTPTKQTMEFALHAGNSNRETIHVKIIHYGKWFYLFTVLNKDLEETELYQFLNSIKLKE